MSEVTSALLFVLLFSTFAIVASDAVARETSVATSDVNTPSAFKALVDSVVKETAIVASAAIRLVASVARLVVKTFSALVALVTSAFKSAEPVDDDAST